MNDFGPKRPMSEDALCVPADTVKTKRGRPKKKPGYDRAEVIDDLLVKVVEFFGTPFDDREERPEDAPTIVSVANALQITPIKVRKMLITAGYYSTAMSRKVQALQDIRRIRSGCTSGISIRPGMRTIWKSISSSIWTILPCVRSGRW